MVEDNLLRLFVDIAESYVYVCDSLSYDLVYINPSLKIALGNPDEKRWKGKKCYQILFGSDIPCSCCTMEIVNKEDFYNWKSYSTILDQPLNLFTIITNRHNKLLRCGIATNIAHGAHERELKSRIEEHEILTECINLLHSSQSVDTSINKALSYIANYYDAERAYIFEYAGPDILNNTYEFCKEDIEPQIDNLQGVPAEDTVFWFENFKMNGEFYIDSMNNPIHRNSLYYEVLTQQGIESLVAAPLIDLNGSNYVGFLGVDNPAKNIKNTNVLRSAARFISDFKDKNELIKTLHKLSYLDGLTGLKNRHSYSVKLNEFEKSTPKNLGVIYVDIDGLKQTNDTKGHKYGDSLILKLSKLLTEIFDDTVYRIGGDEFVIIIEDIVEHEFEEQILQLRTRLDNENELKASIGHSWTEAQGDITKQIEIADNKMYKAKKEFYAIDLRNRKYDTMLQGDLLCEIDSNKFFIFLQPRIDMITNKLLGAKVQVRRQSANGILQEPQVFMPIYEKEGIVSHLDLYIFKELASLLNSYETSHEYKNLRISIPFSKYTLLEKENFNKINNICNTYNVNPDQFIIEFAQSHENMTDRLFKEAIEKLTNAGFSIAISCYGNALLNFGTSKLSHQNEIRLESDQYHSIMNAPKSKVFMKFNFELAYNYADMLDPEDNNDNNEIILRHKNQSLQHDGNTLGEGYYLDSPMTLQAFAAKYLA